MRYFKLLVIIFLVTSCEYRTTTFESEIDCSISTSNFFGKKFYTLNVKRHPPDILRNVKYLPVNEPTDLRIFTPMTFPTGDRMHGEYRGTFVHYGKATDSRCYITEEWKTEIDWFGDKSSWSKQLDIYLK